MRRRPFVSNIMVRDKGDEGDRRKSQDIIMVLFSRITRSRVGINNPRNTIREVPAFTGCHI